MTLIRGGEVYTPNAMGLANVLVGGTQILQFTPLNNFPGLTYDLIDATGMIILPGIIDVHVHASGGGGEGGPASRTPEAQLDQLIDGGVTSVIGLLGTDTVSRSEINLLSKLRGLEQDGLSTFMWSGGYHVPTPSLTGSVIQDLIVIDKVIGFGEIAISDHRSSQPTYQELVRMVADARVGGVLGGKPGKIVFHLGSGKEKIDFLWQILRDTDIPITQMYPHHMSRTNALLAEGLLWMKEGGVLDFTVDGADKNKTLKAILYYRDQMAPLDQLTISSDAYGSLPKFDSHGNLISYTYQLPNVVLNTISKLILLHNWTITDAFKLATANPGKFLGINKGQLSVGADADLLLLDKKTLELKYVLSRGQIVKTPTWTKQPMVPVCTKT